MKTNTQKPVETPPHLPLLYKIASVALSFVVAMILTPGLFLVSSVLFGIPALKYSPNDPKPMLLPILSFSGFMLFFPFWNLVKIGQSIKTYTRSTWKEDTFTSGCTAVLATALIGYVIANTWLRDTQTDTTVPGWFIHFLSLSWILIVPYVLMLISIIFFYLYKRWWMLHESG